MHRGVPPPARGAACNDKRRPDSRPLSLRSKRGGAHHAWHRAPDGLGRRLLLAGRERHQLVGRSARGAGGGLDGALAGTNPLEVPADDQRARLPGDRGLRHHRRSSEVGWVEFFTRPNIDPYSLLLGLAPVRPRPWQDRVTLDPTYGLPPAQAGEGKRPHSPNTKIIEAFDRFRISGEWESLFLALRH